jgi:carbon storage regulator
MLILSRKENESIEIGNDVKITISKVKGNRVNVGIEAPRGTTILRSELRSIPPESVDDATEEPQIENLSI